MKGSTILLSLILLFLLIDIGSSGWIRFRRRSRRRCPAQNCSWRKGSCSKTCGRGYYHFYKKTGNRCGGTCIKPRQTCHLRYCPVNCQLYGWGSWGRCSNTCGKYGVQIRNRRIKVAPRWGGARCPATKQVRRCIGKREICRWKYIGCSKSCGRGLTVYRLTSSNRCRLCRAPVRSCFGKKCGPICPPTNWSRWGSCKIVGGKGIMTRSRTLGSLSCTKKCSTARQSKPCCMTRYCPVRWKCTRNLKRPYFSNRRLCHGVCPLPRPRRCRRSCGRGDEKPVNNPSNEVEDITSNIQQEDLANPKEITTEQSFTDIVDESDLENVNQPEESEIIPEENVLTLADENETDDNKDKDNVEDFQEDQVTDVANNENSDVDTSNDAIDSDKLDEVAEELQNLEMSEDESNIDDAESSAEDSFDNPDLEDEENGAKDLDETKDSKKEENNDENSVKKTTTDDETAEVSDGDFEVEGAGEGEE